MDYEEHSRLPASAGKTRGGLPPLVESGLFLLCGLIIGAGMTAFLMDNSMHEFLTNPGQLPDRLLHRMEQRLDLTDAQRREAERIIALHFETLDGLRREVQPEIQATLDALRDDVSRILDPDQRGTWEENFERIRQKWQPGPLVPSGDEQTAAHGGGD